MKVAARSTPRRKHGSAPRRQGGAQGGAPRRQGGRKLALHAVKVAACSTPRRRDGGPVALHVVKAERKVALRGVTMAAPQRSEAEARWRYASYR